MKQSDWSTELKKKKNTNVAVTPITLKVTDFQTQQSTVMRLHFNFGRHD